MKTISANTSESLELQSQFFSQEKNISQKDERLEGCESENFPTSSLVKRSVNVLVAVSEAVSEEQNIKTIANVDRILSKSGLAEENINDIRQNCYWLLKHNAQPQFVQRVAVRYVWS